MMFIFAVVFTKILIIKKLVMVTKEKTMDFIDRAYETACKHGFHDEEKSNAHWMMLVVSEIGEMVEADRKNRHADLSRFKREYEKYPNLVDEQTRFVTSFEKYVKDGLEDELSDVCIRLYDFCGTLGIEPSDFSLLLKDDFQYTWEDEFGSMSVCEQCYELVACVTVIDDESGRDEICEAVGSCLLFCECFALSHGIDLERHIELKMRYNESRETRHGKMY